MHRGGYVPDGLPSQPPIPPSPPSIQSGSPHGFHAEPPYMAQRAKTVGMDVPAGTVLAAVDLSRVEAAQPVDDYTVPKHNKTDKFRLLSTARPHMRAFHYSWITCSICFFSWFAVSPLLASLEKPLCANLDSPLCTQTCVPTFTRTRDELAFDPECRVCFPSNRDGGCGGLGLSSEQIFMSNAVGVSGTLIIRLFGGPIIDKIGAKKFQVFIMAFAVPWLFWLSRVNSLSELVAARFFISALGASFVGSSAWCSAMFDKKVVGLVGATATGWGKVGGGIAYLVIPEIYKASKSTLTNEESWRYTLLIPPFIVMFGAVLAWFFSDGSPDNDEFLESKDKMVAQNIQAHQPTKIGLTQSFVIAGSNYRTWCMGLLFFASNGVDICMGSIVSYYFVKEFKMHQSDASLAGSVFGLMNFFARSLGGLVSDKLYIRLGLFGRVIVTFFTTFFMGVGLIVFATIDDTNGGVMMAVIVLMITSVFTQAAQGACYGIVPTIEPKAVGAVTGLVGAWGSFGSIVMNLLMSVGFRTAWTIIGYGIIVISFIVFFVSLPEKVMLETLANSLRKHARRGTDLFRATSLSGDSVAEREGLLSLRSGALEKMVLILAEKEHELKKKDQKIAQLSSIVYGESPTRQPPPWMGGSVPVRGGVSMSMGMPTTTRMMYEVGGVMAPQIPRHINRPL